MPQAIVGPALRITLAPLLIVATLGCQRSSSTASRATASRATASKAVVDGVRAASSKDDKNDDESPGAPAAEALSSVPPSPGEQSAMPPENPSSESRSAEKEPASSASSPASAGEKIVRTDAEWRKLLSPEQYHVLREKGTERPFTNSYDHHFEPGAYACAACGQVLFESDAKFNSGCGWPAFYAAKAEDRVKQTADLSHGMVRTEVTCAKCDSHLGHIFDDAPQTPTGQRYCINSVSLKFLPAEK